MTDPREDALAIIQGEGFDRGGFATIIVDGVRYTPSQIRAALTLSPTPYVRPAAEIRAEIERATSRKMLSHFVGEGIRLAGRIEGLTFALTPPTQEPR